MKITIRQLRNFIRNEILEGAGAPPTKPAFSDTNDPNLPSLVDDEKLGKLAAARIEDEYEESLSSHLMNPVEDREDCYGPVPPVANDPYASQDPLARNWSILPRPSIP